MCHKNNLSGTNKRKSKTKNNFVHTCYTFKAVFNLQIIEFLVFIWKAWCKLNCDTPISCHYQGCSATYVTRFQTFWHLRKEATRQLTIWNFICIFSAATTMINNETQEMSIRHWTIWNSIAWKPNAFLASQ